MGMPVGVAGSAYRWRGIHARPVAWVQASGACARGSDGRLGCAPEDCLASAMARGLPDARLAPCTRRVYPVLMVDPQEVQRCLEAAFPGARILVANPAGD